MALTALQRRICRLIAANRVATGEAYVAGGVALNELTGGTRISRDVDLFHDTREALAATWEADRALLTTAGLRLDIRRERPTYVECLVGDDAESVSMEWVCDSAFRFFPLMAHPELGLVPHPFDLATNKVLAGVGRAEARDWVDLLTCAGKLQPLGYLVWAAVGKDPGWNPEFILAELARAHHHRQEDLEALQFAGAVPAAAEMVRQWHAALVEAEETLGLLPVEHCGTCVLGADGELLTAVPAALGAMLAAGGVRFHPGTIRGAFPTVVP